MYEVTSEEHMPGPRRASGDARACGRERSDCLHQIPLATVILFDVLTEYVWVFDSHMDERDVRCIEVNAKAECVHVMTLRQLQF